MKEKKADRKKINKINEMQRKFGGYKPDLIVMYYASRLDCLTKTLIVLSVILIVLSIFNIVLLMKIIVLVY